MTHDPPETRATWKDVQAEALRRLAERQRAEGRTDTANAIDRAAAKAEEARDPSNLNDPALQRWVVAFAWLLTLALLGTCVAGGACLLGAFRGDAESEAS